MFSVARSAKFNRLWLVVCTAKWMDSVLEIVKAYADKAHGNQQRKYSPERFIEHPVRVMEICRCHTGKQILLAAALLHDVLEDTPVTEQDLYRFLLGVMAEEEASETTLLVFELTDVFTKAAHPQWNRKKRKKKEAERIRTTSGDSQTVKYADIIDNCRGIANQDPDFAGVFLRECRDLLQVIQKGEQALYREAIETVHAGLQQLRLHGPSRG